MSIVAIIPAKDIVAANEALDLAGKYFVYAHTDSNGLPFYIGKGHARRHLETRRRNLHHTNCLKKHGLNAIIMFSDLSEKDALNIERQVIAETKAMGFALANYTDGGEGSTGYTHTEEALQKMRASSTGVSPSKESVAKAIQTRSWYRHSDETKAKISSKHMGKSFSPESRAKMSASQKKLAAGDDYSNPRKGAVLSDATKEKLAAANIGKTISAEARAKISAKLKGRVFTEEHKKRIGASRRAAWVRKMEAEK